MDTISLAGMEIPADATELDGFRRWVAGLGEGAPRVSFVRGRVYVEMSPQKYRSHASPSAAILGRLITLSEEQGVGMFFPPPSWITCEPVGLSTEPDGFFARYETLRTGRLRLNPDREHEMMGRPDMVLEIVSPSSVRKDVHDLRATYAEAGVGEYWLIDARAETPTFELLVLEGEAYVGVVADSEGFRTSPTFATAFRLRRFVNPAGLPEFRLDVRAA